MSGKSRDDWPEAIADDDASLLWFVAKSSFLPKNHRKLQESHNVFNEYFRQNADAIVQFRLRTKDLHREAQIVQSNIRQQESCRSEAPSGQSRPASYLEYSQETASAPFMNIDTKIAASPEPSTHAADFAERGRVNQAKLTSELRPHYYFVVCGTGSSGSVLARRLAENPEGSVLLLEAGGRDDAPGVMEAGQWPANLGTERDWAFQAQPNPHLNGRSIPMNMGKVLGGGSSINAMVWARGHKNDWDYFASEAGDPAWSYESVLNMYRRIED